MQCATCRGEVARATVCATCGTPAPGGIGPLELAVEDGRRVALVRDVSIGRSSAHGLKLDDPSVSRDQARIRVDRDGLAWLEDAGSTWGTFVDDVRVTDPVALRAGSRIRVGNQRIAVQPRPDDNAAGETIVVDVGASALMPAVGASLLGPAGAPGNPRLRSGYALKRLDASEGERRWVVRDLRGTGFMRLSDRDAELFQFLDGTRTTAELIDEAVTRSGEHGSARLARLLSDLGDRGMLAGVQGAATAGDAAPVRGWRRLTRTRERTIEGADAFFDRVYRGGGRVLFTRPVVIGASVLAGAGFCAWLTLVIGRYGTPFVVADRLVLGGLVFLVGRGLLVVVHELAHGLALKSLGRRVPRAGFKLVAVFPYAFVDTSEAWFEPRRNRTAVSAAGPLSDLALAGIFSILCLLLAPGTIRDVAFQVAFAGYAAAFFNLNPFLDRDGYQILADQLGVSGLRTRARDVLRRRLSGEHVESLEPTLIRYALAGIAWSMAAAVIVIVVTMRYQPIMELYAPAVVVWIVLATLWMALLAPIAVLIGPPLRTRMRGGVS